MDFLISNAYAQAAAGGTNPEAGLLASPLVFIGIMVVMMFFMFRSQSKRQKELKAMIAALAKGDEVVSNGGIAGRIELTEGGAFAPEDLTDVHQGIWHTGALDRVQFVQGNYTVDYAAGMARGPTHSEILIPDGQGGWERRVVGDDRPLVLEGYRFYTTFNKGFAPILTWIPDRGEAVTGSVHMPAYPLFDNRQANRWTPPGVNEVRFWLELKTGLDPQRDWRLDPARATGTLVVRAPGVDPGVDRAEQRVELQPGETLRLDGGTLRYERLSSWMGYKLFYDPTLHWLFIAAMITVIGLAAHFWRKFGAVQVYAAAQEAVKNQPADDLGGKPV